MFQDWQEEDTCKHLAVRWLSKLQMAMMSNSGGLIKRQRLSRIGNTKDGHLIFVQLEEAMTCKHGTLTQDGGNFSSLKMRALSMLRMAKFLMFLEAEIKKETELEFTKRMDQKHKNGLFSMKTKKIEESLEV